VVECNLAKVEVAGSNPVSRSKAEAHASAFFLLSDRPMVDPTDIQLSDESHAQSLRFVRLKLDPTQINNKLYCLLAPSKPEFNSFKAMAQQLSQLCGGSGIIWVTCPYEGRGCSVTALNLGGALAESAQTTVLDLRFGRPAVAPMLGVLPKRGVLASLTNLRGRAPEPMSVQMIAPRFGIVPMESDGSEELVIEPEFAELMRTLRRGNDFVVLDGPPVIPVRSP
jgi:Mrp family chromosome partitioning ATPase